MEAALSVDVYKIIAVLENISQSLCFLLNKRDLILFTPYGSIFVWDGKYSSGVGVWYTEKA